jgi:hypothetical protein
MDKLPQWGGGRREERGERREDRGERREWVASAVNCATPVSGFVEGVFIQGGMIP